MDDHEKAHDKAGKNDSADDEGLIELTDTVNSTGADGDAVLENGDDFIELTELAEVPPTPESAVAPTDEQLEQALRKVVKEVYAEKIEGLLLEVVQETVTREIEKIKRLLSDGGADKTS